MSLTTFWINFLEIFIVVVFSFVCLEYISKRTKFKILTTKLPTAYGLPFFGTSYKFLPLERFLYEIGNYFITFKTSTYFTWFGTNPFVITVDPDFVKVVLSSEEFLTKARTIYSSIANALPNGLMTRNGVEWKSHRKLMNFSYSQQVLKNLVPIFNKHGQNMCEKFDALVDSNEHDVFSLVKRMALQTAIETTMGVELKDGNALDGNVANGFNYVLHEAAREMIYNSVHLGFLCHTPKYKRTIKFLRNYAEKLINTQCTLNKTTNDHDCDEDGKQKAIFLQQAVSYYERGLFQLDDVITETHTVIAGAFDTITTTVYSIIMLLAMHPDIQEKLYFEICNAIPIANDEIDYEDTKLIPYMDMVIDEALRVMPSIPVIGRQTNQDIEINRDIKLPKNMQVLIPIFTLHRRKDLWGPNADAFDPENFLPEKVSKRHPYAYIPFSKGGRVCLGLRYAYVAVRVILLKILPKFKFSTSFKYEDLIFIDYISLRCLVEPKIKIERRKT